MPGQSDYSLGSIKFRFTPSNPFRGVTVKMQLLTTKEAAQFLGVSKAFLERDRWAGARIPFIRVGDRAVRYRVADLEAYIASRQRTSTSY